MPKIADPIVDKIVYELRKDGLSWNEIKASLDKTGITKGRSTIRDSYKRESERRNVRHKKQEKEVVDNMR